MYGNLRARDGNRGGGEELARVAGKALLITVNRKNPSLVERYPKRFPYDVQWFNSHSLDFLKEDWKIFSFKMISPLTRFPGPFAGCPAPYPQPFLGIPQVPDFSLQLPLSFPQEDGQKKHASSPFGAGPPPLQVYRSQGPSFSAGEKRRRSEKNKRTENSPLFSHGFQSGA